MNNRSSIFSRVAAGHQIALARRTARSVVRDSGALVETLEARQMMAADLAIEAGDAFTPLAFYVPGEVIAVPFTVRNNGADPFTGRASVTLKLTSFDNGVDPVVDFSSTPVVITMNNTAADGTVTGTASFTFTGAVPASAYSILLTVTPQSSNGTVVPDEWEGNNTATQDQSVNVTYVAGNYGGRTGVVLRLADLDGTRFSVTMAGGGYALYTAASPGIDAALSLFGVSGVANSAQPAQTLSIAFVAGGTGPNVDAFIDFAAADVGINDGTVTPGTSTGSTLRLTAINAPALNIKNLAIGSTAAGIVATPTAITLRDIADGDTLDANVTIGRTVGAVTIRNLEGSVQITGSAAAVRATDITGGSLSVSGTIASLVANDLLNADISINSAGAANRTAVPVTLRNVATSKLNLGVQVSTFTVGNWFQAAPGTDNYLSARAIATLTTGTVAVPTIFGATVFVTGGLSRPTQLGTVTINGVLTGSFYVIGSVGAFTARVVQSGTFIDPFTSGWAPALAASGSVLSFTSTDVRSGALWVNSARTVSLTAAVAGASFEVVAGFRANRSAMANFSPTEVLTGTNGGADGNGAGFRSGVLGTLNLTIAAGGTGFTGRFAAGIDALSDPTLRDGTTGLLDFATAATVGSLTTTQTDTVSRINAINVIGTVTGTSIQFAALTFPTAQFTYGTNTPPVRVTIPAAGANPTQGAIIGVIPADTFFRVGRPLP